MLPLVRLQRSDLLAEVGEQLLGELGVGLPVGLAAELFGFGRVFVSGVSFVVRLEDGVFFVFAVVFLVFFLFLFFFFLFFVRGASWSSVSRAASAV